MPRGKYVVIEGHDGTGKSTQVELLRAKLREKGINSVEMHEPGGVAFADRLREVIKDGELERDAITNLLLFTAARRELWRQLALPALERGEWVIAARNWYSTLAYQGYGEGVDRHVIQEVTQQFMDREYIEPDTSVVLTLEDAETRSQRIHQRNAEHLDTFEMRDAIYQKKVHDGYLAIAKQFNLPIINASQTREAVLHEIMNKLGI